MIHNRRQKQTFQGFGEKTLFRSTMPSDGFQTKSIIYYNQTDRISSNRNLILFPISFLWGTGVCIDRGSETVKPVRLRMVQTESAIGDIEKNVDGMLDFVNNGHDVICFPEMCLTGYSSEQSPKHAINTEDESIKKLVGAACEYGTTVVFGFPERSSDGVYVTQAAATPDGGLELYRKTHLGRFEKKYFLQGDGFLCAETENVSIGLQLCWESHIPDISTVLRHMGAELILNPHASFKDSGKRVEIWKKYLPARAYDNRVFFAACDAIKDGRGGGIIVLDPRGDVVGEHSSSEEYALDCVLDPKLLKRASPEDKGTMDGMDFFLKRRPELYRP